MTTNSREDWDSFESRVVAHLAAIEADDTPEVRHRLAQIIKRGKGIDRSGLDPLGIWLGHSAVRKVAYEAATGIHPDLSRMPRDHAGSAYDWFLDHIKATPVDCFVTSEMIAHHREGQNDG